jgi:hypothetical protein
MGRRSMEPLSVSHPAARRISAALEASLDGMVAAAVDAIWEQVPAYQACQDDRLREQVAGHVRAVFRAFLMWLAGGRVAQQADFTVTREQAARRVAQRISLADFLKAFRISQLTLWEGVRDAAGDDAGAREVALLAVAQLMQVFELGSTVAAEAYVEAQQHALAEGDRVRRDLLEDLLARHAAVAGPKRSLLRLPGSARTRGCWSPRRPRWGSGPTTGSCGTPPWGVGSGAAGGTGWRSSARMRSSGSCRCRRAGRRWPWPTCGAPVTISSGGKSGC